MEENFLFKVENASVTKKRKKVLNNYEKKVSSINFSAHFQSFPSRKSF